MLPDQLKNICICEEHFTEDCFMNETHKYLTRIAVPIHYGTTSILSASILIRFYEKKFIYVIITNINIYS